MGKSLYLLFESAYGYGIFKVIEAEELASSLPKVLKISLNIGTRNSKKFRDF